MTDAPDLRRLRAADRRSLVLVGMMGAGKTSVGKRLAARLGLPFVDADEEIEAGARMTDLGDLREVRRTLFPRRRAARHRAGAGAGPCVLATGGGAFMNAATRERIAARRHVDLAQAGFRVLLRRVRKRSNRPLLQTPDPEGTLRRLLEERSPTYALADITIESHDGPHEAWSSRSSPRSARPRRRSRPSAVAHGARRTRARAATTS